MIELRWVKRVTARYPSGSPMCTERVLQYRQPYSGAPNAALTYEQRDTYWSDWTDVPVEGDR